MTSRDELGFLASIRDDPDNDTIRLAYADWLDGIETVYLPCDNPKCGNPAVGWDEFYPCRTCKGKGHLGLDTSNHDRAELIRVQCELEQTPDPKCLHCWPGNGCRFHELQRRESALIAANGKRWRKGPECEKCEGTGWEWHIGQDVGDGNCPDCFGTGDAGGLMRKFTTGRIEDGTSVTELVHVAYHRGMNRVEVLHAADTWEPNTPGHVAYGKEPKWKPTAWASAVCRCHPDVTEVVVGDKKPFRLKDSRDPDAIWFDGDRGSTSLPSPIFAVLKGGILRSTIPAQRIYPTEAAAVTALARTVPRWVHSFMEAKA